MRFSEQEIRLAQRLRRLGLTWEPGTGHYVWDEVGLIDCRSPFHDQIYFILDLKHFLRRAGTVQSLKAAMTWLPTWHDAREILKSLGVSHESVAQRLTQSNAIVERSELATLYRLIAEALQSQHAEHAESSLMSGPAPL